MVSAYLLESAASTLCFPTGVWPSCSCWSLFWEPVVSPGQCIAQGVWHFWELSKGELLLVLLTKDQVGASGFSFLWKNSRCISVRILGNVVFLRHCLQEGGSLYWGKDHILPCHHVHPLIWFMTLLCRQTLDLTWYVGPLGHWQPLNVLLTPFLNMGVTGYSLQKAHVEPAVNPCTWAIKECRANLAPVLESSLAQIQIIIIFCFVLLQ